VFKRVHIRAQETSELFRDVRKLVLRRNDKECARNGKLVVSVLDSGLVDLAQKIWQKCLRPEILDNNDDLPSYILTSLGVTKRNAIEFCSPIL